MTTTVSPDQSEITRKDAARIQSEILQRIAQMKQVNVAERMGVNASTISRFVSDDLYRFCELMAVLGFQVAPNDAVITTQDELNVLKMWAIRFLESDLRSH